MHNYVWDVGPITCLIRSKGFIWCISMSAFMLNLFVLMSHTMSAGATETVLSLINESSSSTKA